MSGKPIHTTSLSITSLPHETELVNDLSQGSRYAFTQLYKHYQPRILQYILPFSEAYGEDADSVIQDIFIKLWEKKETLIGVYAFEYYLQRMARNRLIDLYRSHQTRKKHEADLSAPRITDIEDDLQFREYDRLVQESIKKMPARRQLIFKLSSVHDLGLDEIAAATGLSKAVVKKQLFKANNYIRSILKKQSILIILLL